MAGRVETHLVLQTKDLASQGLGRIRTAMSGVLGVAGRLSGVIAGLAGVGSVAGIVMLGRRSIEAGDEVAKMGKRFGIAAEELSSFKYAADIAGVELKSLGSSMKFMMRNIGDAMGGTGEAMRTFRAMRLDPRQLSGMDADKQFLAIANALGQVGNKTLQASYAMRVFGRDGQSVLQMIANGTGELQANIDKARKRGWFVSNQDAADAEQLKDMLTDLGYEWEQTMRRIFLSNKEMIADSIALMQDLVESSAKAAGGIARTVSSAIDAVVEDAITTRSSYFLQLLDKITGRAPYAAKQSGPTTPAEIDALARIAGARDTMDTSLPPRTITASRPGFFDGMRYQLADMEEDFNATWGRISQVGEESAKVMAKAMSGAFNSFFMDAIEGRLKQFKDYLLGFLRDIAAAMSKVLAEQMTINLIGAALGTRMTGGAGTPAASASIGRGKAGGVSSPAVQIINNTGTPMQGSAQMTTGDMGEAVMSVVLDSVYRNKGGSRDMLRGMLA
jgi:hypothetical protein